MDESLVKVEATLEDKFIRAIDIDMPAKLRAFDAIVDQQGDAKVSIQYYFV